MKKLGLLFILFFTVSCATTPIFYSKQIIPSQSKIAVLPFKDYLTNNNSGALITDMFTVYFLENGFLVAEREKINQVITEKKYELAGLTDATFREFGYLLDVDYILTGSITDFQSYSNKKQLFYLFEWLELTFNIGVTARLFNVRTGEIIWVGIANDQGQSFKSAAQEVVDQLFETISITNHS